MEHLIRINRIAERADAIGVTLSALCLSAGVRPGAVHRWMKGEGARIAVYDDRCTKLEAELDRRELALLADLAARHGCPPGGGR